MKNKVILVLTLQFIYTLRQSFDPPNPILEMIWKKRFQFRFVTFYL